MAIDYPIYYKKCQQTFATDKRLPLDASSCDIGLKIIDPYSSDTLINIPEHYLNIVRSIASETNERFKNSKEIYVPKESNPKKENLIRLDNPLTINNVNNLADIIIPQIESQFFQSYIHLSHLYVYRSIVTKAEPLSSWLWHYDNYPTEIHKIIIYLTDVDENSGPFEYLINKDNEPVIIEPSRTGPNCWNKPKLKGSRIPAKMMRKYLEKGHSVKKLTGKAGTGVIFDNNCIHRATVAKKQHRDVIAFQIKPYEHTLSPFINAKWTGSFQYKGLSQSPSELMSNKE